MTFISSKTKVSLTASCSEMAFPPAEMAALARLCLSYNIRSTWSYHTKRVRQCWGRNRFAGHDQDSEENLFEGAWVDEISEDSEIIQEAALVPSNEVSHKIRIFYSSVETDPTPQTYVELPEDRPVLDSDSNDATDMYNVQLNQAVVSDPLFHADTEVCEPSDFMYMWACMFVCMSECMYVCVFCAYLFVCRCMCVWILYLLFASETKRGSRNKTCRYQLVRCLLPWFCLCLIEHCVWKLYCLNAVDCEWWLHVKAFSSAKTKLVLQWDPSTQHVLAKWLNLRRVCVFVNLNWFVEKYLI